MSRISACLTAVALAAALLPACASMQRSAGDPCEPMMSGTLPAGTATAPMAGRFVLTMVSRSGPAPGAAVAGYLTLRQAPAGTPGPAAGARTAFMGGTDILLESAGALRLGDTGSDDPRAPGVAVYEQRAASGVPTVTARIGSHTTAAPDSTMRQIEGQFTVLFVRRIARDGFAGSWQSGGPLPGSGTQGYFCASRIES